MAAGARMARSGTGQYQQIFARSSDAYFGRIFGTDPRYSRLLQHLRTSILRACVAVTID